MGWKLNRWARLLDGDHAYRVLETLVQPAAHSGPGSPGRAGLFPEPVRRPPPFQIDGNFGVTAGIAEMLLQSHDPHATPASIFDVQTDKAAFLHLLPALPSALSTGSVSGLCARGGPELDLERSAGRLSRAVLRATRSIPARVRYAGREVSLNASAGQAYSLGPDLRPSTRMQGAHRDPEGP
jgi:alpha-L-fucosidase 2